MSLISAEQFCKEPCRAGKGGELRLTVVIQKCPYPLKIHIEIFMAEMICLGVALRQCSGEAVGGVIDKKRCLLANDDYS